MFVLCLWAEKRKKREKECCAHVQNTHSFIHDSAGSFINPSGSPVGAGREGKTTEWLHRSMGSNLWCVHGGFSPRKVIGRNFGRATAWCGLKNHHDNALWSGLFGPRFFPPVSTPRQRATDARIAPVQLCVCVWCELWEEKKEYEEEEEEEEDHGKKGGVKFILRGKRWRGRRKLFWVTGKSESAVWSQWKKNQPRTQQFYTP